MTEKTTAVLDMKIVTTADLERMFRVSRELVRRNVQRGIWPYLPTLGRKPYHFDLDRITEIVRGPSSLTIQKSRRNTRKKSSRSSSK